MAVGTLPGKVLRIVVGGCGFVAACAVGWGFGVTAVFVAVQTFNPGMAPAEGEVLMVYVLF